MLRCIKFGLAAVTVVALPICTAANAATYVGTLTGTITSGFNQYIAPYDDNPPLNDLTGYTISVAFSSTIENNVTDPFTGAVVPRNVINSYTVTVPDFDSTPLFSGHSETATGFYPDVSNFTGDENAATFVAIPKTTYGGYYQSDTQLTFSYAHDMAGNLTGSGNGSYFYDGYYSGDMLYDNVAFTLTGGSVTALGTPEPATWMLMIGGFGAIGGALRRRNRQMQTA